MGVYFTDELIMFSCALSVLVISAILWIFRKLRHTPWVPDITKKAVFISGCDSGFGRAAALRLDALGVPVFAGCYTEDGARSLKASGSSRLHTLPLDVTKEDSVQRAYTYVMDNLPKDGTVLWGIINNAGIFEATAPLDFNSTQDFRSLYDVNFFGLVSVTLTFLPALKKSRGRIINTSSFATLMPLPYWHIYCSSKCAIMGFSNCIRLELKQWGVKVCIIQPGGYHTNLQTNQFAQFEKIWERKPEMNQDYGPEYLDAVKKQIPQQMAYVNKDLSQVVDSYQHALFAQHPKTHYRVVPFIRSLISKTPAWFMDWLTLKIPALTRPLPSVLRQ